MPKVAVFDLDETLWPFDVDGWEFKYPFRRGSGDKVVDSRGKVIKPFPHATQILNDLHSKGVKLGVASRTSFTEGAHALIDLFGWNKVVDYKEAYPGCKVTHFNKIQKDSKVKFSDMIFFDNEYRNIRDISKLGVTCVLVDSYAGITPKDIENGLKLFRESKESKS